MNMVFLLITGIGYVVYVVSRKLCRCQIGIGIGDNFYILFYQKYN